MMAVAHCGCRYMEQHSRHWPASFLWALRPMPAVLSGVLTAAIPAASMPARWHGKHSPLERWRERSARGLTAFFLALSCSPLAAVHPKTWQPPKASRTYRFTEYLRPLRNAARSVGKGKTFRFAEAAFRLDRQEKGHHKSNVIATEVMTELKK